MYTSSLVLNGVTLESIGSYTCTATNEGGTATADAMLNVTGKKYYIGRMIVTISTILTLFLFNKFIYLFLLSHSQYLLHQYQYLMIVSI